VSEQSHGLGGFKDWLRKVIRYAAAQSKERILKSRRGLGKFHAMVFCKVL
jgi:hypothetical protein